MRHDSSLTIIRFVRVVQNHLRGECGCSDSDLTALGTEDRRLQSPMAPLEPMALVQELQQDQDLEQPAQVKGSLGYKGFADSHIDCSLSLIPDAIPFCPSFRDSDSQDGSRHRSTTGEVAQLGHRFYQGCLL